MTVSFFALLEEEMGTSRKKVETYAETPEELYEELAEKHSLEISSSSMRVAVNDEFSGWDTSLSEDDLVAFIPPVAGGSCV